MHSEKITAYATMTVALLLLPLGIYVIARLSGSILLGFSACLVTLALHLPQLPAARRACAGKDISGGRIAFMTVLFGASWWKNVEKGILD